jgi:hypothetical protein
MSNQDLREFRFAVGSKTGSRSTIWKCWVHGNEVYITGHLFGTEAKISLHSTGECQWSFMENWVLGNATRRNSDRHITIWNLTYPKDDNAILALRIGIPVSELRVQPVPPRQKKYFGYLMRRRKQQLSSVFTLLGRWKMLRLLILTLSYTMWHHFHYSMVDG